MPLPPLVLLDATEAVCYGTFVSQVRGNNSVVECDLAKVEVAGSNPVSRSILFFSLQSSLPDGAVAKW